MKKLFPVAIILLCTILIVGVFMPVIDLSTGYDDNDITTNLMNYNTQINNNTINVIEDTKKDNNTSESTLIDITVEDNINLTSQQQELMQKGYDVLGYDFCKGHSIGGSAGTALTPWTCKICGYSEVNPDTAVPTLCKDCANLTKRCEKCGKIINEKQREQQKQQEKLKSEQKGKDSGITSSSIEKITYIVGTDNIAFLVNSRDTDKETYSNKILIKDMKDYSIVDTINLFKKYSDKIDDITDAFIDNRKYEGKGRFFCDDGNLILINSSKEKSFIYNLKARKLINEFEWSSGEYKGEDYLYIKNIYNQKEYYYFEKYDIIKTSLNNLDLTKYFIDPYIFIDKDCLDAQIVYQDDSHIIIAYYEIEYDKVKIKLYDKSGQLLDLQQANLENLDNSKIIVYNENLIVKYDVKEEKEIWSYDYNIITRARIEGVRY